MLIDILYKIQFDKKIRLSDLCYFFNSLCEVNLNIIKYRYFSEMLYINILGNVVY